MKKGCLISSIVVLGILSIALGYYFYKQSVKDPVVYESESPEIATIIKKSVATGSIKPRKEVQIKPQISGVVDELYVEAGDIVAKGQQLAKIKLVPSPVNINNAESGVELARIRARDAEREYERQKSIFENNLDVQAALANFENASREEERNRQLFEDGIISEQEYNRIALDKNVRETELKNARILAQNNLKQFEADLEIRKQELDAAITNLQLLREGASRKYGQISNTVVSTVDGMVLDVPIEEGSSVIERNNFNEGTSIAVVADMNSLIFEGKVDESEVGKLKEGMPLELTVGALEKDTFEAILEHIAPQGVLEEGTVKFEIKAAITPNHEAFLRAGYSASGDIILEKQEDVLSIQERDVIFAGDTTYVEVETGDQKYEKKEIDLGLSDGIRVQVLGGIQEDTKIKVQRKG
ncbi:MAG: HlyD family efflux transporter periplasmic adaptor subunit [Saprospiraceae bacterium]|nr:HlyD family efflux transporter periplasmic adaptor subunit [Saprospiraceae bacterium]